MRVPPSSGTARRPESRRVEFDESFDPSAVAVKCTAYTWAALMESAPSDQ